jgi:hypothetical protein
MRIGKKSLMGLTILMTLSIGGCISASSIETAESKASPQVISKCRRQVPGMNATVQDQSRELYLSCLQANGVKL